MADDRRPEHSGQETRTRDEASGAARFIGNYRIIRKLGEGGMGIVYEAEQQQPRRLVALKVIRGEAYVDDSRIRLFQREAQTLARLRHPGIAVLYESGRTDEGQHFFAMEIVRGETLDTYATRTEQAGSRRGAVRERLALFRKICDAVGYAHQRGVIHRDLKPSNVIVVRDVSGSSSASPGGAEIKILDFGLARITDSDIAASTMVTEAGSIRGTLPYMSPEQVRGNPDEIDVRSDVYSLGVILYELLLGRLPYELDRRSLPDAVRVICEQPPTSPRQARAVGGRIDPDLETIVLKALEKSPNRRFQSVIALAEDVQRYLVDQPILARPPSAFYQIRKLVARHRVGFGFVAALIIFLGALATTMTVQAGRIARERDRANQEAQTARQVSDFLVRLFEVSDPEQRRGDTMTAREILQRGVSRIDQDLRGQPAVQARLTGVMGSVYLSLGLYEEARPLLERSLALAERRSGTESVDAALALISLGNLHQYAGRLDEAEPLFRRALAIHERREAPDSLNAATCLNNLGNLLGERGNNRDAEALLRRSLDIRRRKLGPSDADIGRSLVNLGLAVSRSGRLPEAEKLAREGIPILEASLGRDHPGVASAWHNLGNAYVAQGRYADGEDALRRTVEITERAFGPEHPRLAYSMEDLGLAFVAQRKFAEAEPLLKRSLEIKEKMLGPNAPKTGISLLNLGLLYQESGRPAAAEPLYRHALDVLQNSLGAEHPLVAQTLNNLANLRFDAGKSSEAEILHRRALGIREKALGPDHPDVAQSLLALGHLRGLQGASADAESLTLRALAVSEKAFGSASPQTSAARYNVACIYALLGNRSQALRYLERAVEGGFASDGIEQDTDLKGLRGDPTFTALAEKARQRARGR